MPAIGPRFRTLLLATAAALALGSHAIAEPGTPTRVAASTEQSPFLGLWELDLTRMPDTYGPPPKRVTYSFEDIGAGKWRTRVEITAPDNSVRRIAMEYARDGRAVPGEGDDADGDTAAFGAPAPNVLVMSVAKNGHASGVRVYVISPDGQEMTEAAANVDAAGAPFVRSFHFRRVR